ncbi:O-phosphoseryl-tRNA(Sec) selenium transferase [Anopheles marshallii]|uniref:O-phosphoseryl-tRNA(Sec) selenium transferase n=1 Tax=Anopheles marshallii TaxID=1521116 RepID=UPI00237C0331|nr:O-phosphoseryl-tRNA(Sec) selenium transferase [Anopheles marshallii]
MNDTTLKSIAKSLVPENYLAIANDARAERDKAIKLLLEKRKLPVSGWSETMIEYFVSELALLDSNNFPSRCGVGEREGRVICDLVRRRHYNFAHGIGRSGNLTDAQPKAAGSTIMANLTNSLVCDWIKSIGVPNCSKAIVIPLATGMTMMLVLRAIHSKRPTARYVLWSRVDQQSCFKAIAAAGLTPIVIDSLLVRECSVTESSHAQDVDSTCCTDLPQFVLKIKELGADQICCIVSTTSCFAPRSSDDIIELAKLCQVHDIPHIVNNAYGLQSSYFAHQLNQGARVGRIDAFVQSTDKNLLVPVGGAIVAGFTTDTVDAVAQLYPGRASGTQSLDVLMTLLSLGKNGYDNLMKERKIAHGMLLEGLTNLAQSHGERILPCRNPISIAMSLVSFEGNSNRLEIIGSMLLKRGVSGCRVVTTVDTKTIDGNTFLRWGSHNSAACVPYLTASAALGINPQDITNFLTKLDEVFLFCFHNILMTRATIIVPRYRLLKF